MKMDRSNEDTGLKYKSGNAIHEGHIVRVHSRSYGIFDAPVVWNHEKACFAISTFGSSGVYPKQIDMPDRKWDREHDPCGCDGAMYEVYYRPLGDNLDKIEETER